MIAAISRTPSVSAAGPGCRMFGDLISCSAPSRTAGIAPQPGRAATFSGRNFLPHHEPRMMSGARRMTSSASSRMRCDPLDAADRRIVPFLEIHRGPARQRRGFAPDVIEAAAQRIGIGDRAFAGADQRAEAADVVEDAVDAAVVADPDLDAVPDQFGGDLRLDIGETDDEVRLELEDLADLGAGERADLRLLPARDRGTHGEAADADDAVLLAERIERFGRLLGEADDAARTVDAMGTGSR